MTKRKYKSGLEKTFANHVSDKGHVAKMYKELSKFSNKNTKHHNEKRARDVTRRLTKDTPTAYLMQR